MAEEEKNEEAENEQPEPETPEAPEAEQPAEDPAAPGREAEEAAGGDVESEGNSGEKSGEAADAAGSDVDSDSDPGEEGEAADAAGSDLGPKALRKRRRAQAPAEARPQRGPEERAAERSERRRANAVRRRRYRQGRRAKRGEAGVGTPPAERESAGRKVRQGTVVSSKGDKTITVRIELVGRHRRYEKVVRRSRTLHAHDESNQASEGDVVRVVETRPLSRTKRWRLVDIVERAR